MLLDLLERVVLIWMLISVEAAQTNSERNAIDLLHAKLAVMVDGVHFAVDDIAQRVFPHVHAYSSAVAQHGHHTVAANLYTLRIAELDAVMAQVLFIEAQTGVGAFLNRKPARSGRQFYFMKEGDVDLIVIERGFVIPSLDGSQFYAGLDPLRMLFSRAL